MRFFSYIIILSVALFSGAAQAEDYKLESGEEMYVQSMTILASTSVAVPVTEISKKYSRKVGVDINTVYDATSELIYRIKEGDPADIIITPSRHNIEAMKEEGLIDSASIKKIAVNDLSIVAVPELGLARDNDVTKVLEAVHNKSLMIIGNPETTSLGEFTKSFLQKNGQWQKFENRVVLSPTSAKTTDLIIKGQSAGIVYSSDLGTYSDKLQELVRIPAKMHEPIEYYAAVVVSGNMSRAREYLKYLDGKEAKEIFEKDGFARR